IYFMYIASTLYFIAAIIMLMFFWEALTARIRQMLLFFFIMVTAGTLFQLLFSPAHTELLCDALALTGILVTIENEGSRRDPRTDILNLPALMEDLKKLLKSREPFHIIGIKMKNPMGIMQIVGPANIESLTLMNVEYFKSFADGESIYYVGLGSFVLLYENTEKDKCAEIADQINERFKQPWEFMGHKSTFDANVFLVGVPDDVASPGELGIFINAPLPPEIRKRECVISGSMIDIVTRQSRVEKSIISGIRNRHFELNYQPIYSAKTMNICSGEALLRLRGEESGETLYPSDFLPIAERSGLIFEIGDFVLEEVCKFLNSGIPAEMGVETIHINLSVVQCMQQNYAARIKDTVSTYNVDPSQINFEIMESAAAADFETLREFVNELREAGFTFSVNDYGIGYSNIHSVFHLGIDSVKIDKSILREAGQSETGRIILESSVSMIKKMGKKIIISGVENQGQVDMAEKLGIDLLQGFFFSNPVSQNEFINILKATKLAKIEEQKAIASNEAMSSFLANMSHEIRTPINAVLGMDEMILRESTDEKITGYAKTIEGAGKTLLSLINDILDFSKIESGRLDILEGEYDLSSVILDVVAMVSKKAGDKGLALITDVDPQTPDRLIGDEMRIRQVILNILNNAIKYTQKGSVVLRVTYEKAEMDGIILKIDIKDTGIGIRQEDMPHLFEKFGRLDMEKNKTIEGTGLGLAITRQILELMDGSIEAESTYGKGSVFSITLPQKAVDMKGIGSLDKKLQGRSESDKKLTRYHMPDARLLLVDDTPVNHIVVKELLSDTGARIDEANSGSECLSLVKKNSYDIILLDYRMPEMDGIETLRKFKELEDNKSKDAAVIALTANAIAGARERFVQEGFDDYVTKPVSGKRLLEVLLLHLPDDKIEWVNAGSDAEKPLPEKDDRKENVSDKTAGADLLGAEDAGNEEPDSRDDEAVRALTMAGIDVNAGIRNCGSRDSFFKVLDVFMHDLPVKSDALKKALDEGDLERYSLEAHS
ncbi:MAG: EAL domain-containing protein, partial [Lachnospiraceae bacterium]|nr:EAL domain-containing protein [Lachnospiraceae bacterium]